MISFLLSMIFKLTVSYLSTCNDFFDYSNGFLPMFSKVSKYQWFTSKHQWFSINDFNLLKISMILHSLFQRLKTCNDIFDCSNGFVPMILNFDKNQRFISTHQWFFTNDFKILKISMIYTNYSNDLRYTMIFWLLIQWFLNISTIFFLPMIFR